MLAVGSHPDDCELGCGATLADHAANGDEVTILVMTKGAMSRDGATVADMDLLAGQSRQAAGILGAKLDMLSYPDQGLDKVGALALAKVVSAKVEELRPSVVYTHYHGDLNRDHRETFEAVAVACRPQLRCSVRALYSFEVPSSTEWAGHGAAGFRPNVFSQVIETDLDKKLRALACYTGEARPSPHPRSDAALRALARWRGASAGVVAAEAFELVRELR